MKLSSSHVSLIACELIVSRPSVWFQQQLQVQHLSQLQGLALPVTPLPLGLTPPTLPAVSSSSGLLSLSSILANYSHGQAPVVKEDKARDAAERAPRGEDGDKSD